MGGFGVATHVAVGMNPRGLAAGDFNRDGFIDLAVADQRPVPPGGPDLRAVVAVLPGDGGGGFFGPQAVFARLGEPGLEMVTADFDADGRIDIAETDGEFFTWVRRNLCGVRTDLSLSVVDSADPVQGGDDLIYTFTVTNHGPDLASQVSVEARFPDGLTPKSILESSSGFSCAVLALGLVRCDTPDLPAEGPLSTAWARIHVSVDSTITQAPGTPFRAFSDTVDPDPTNNAETEITSIRALAGRRFTISETAAGGAALQWHGGDLQAAMVVGRLAGGATTQFPTLPKGATQFIDPSPVTGERNCYAVTPVDAAGAALGRSEMLCLDPGHASASGAPGNFTLTLDGTTATFTWIRPVEAFTEQTLVFWRAGAPPARSFVNRGAETATRQLISEPICYSLVMLNFSTVVGNSPVLCVVPGVSTFP